MVYKYIYIGVHFAHTMLDNRHKNVDGISEQLGRLSGKLSTKPCLLNAPHSSTFVHQHKLELQTKLWRPMTNARVRV